MSAVEPHRATITVEWAPDTSEDDSAAIRATLDVACDELVEALYHDAVSITLVNHSDHPAHRYVSTACLHSQHTLCRRACKYCPASCACTGCDHTGIEDRPGRELHRGPTRPAGDDGSQFQAWVDLPPGSTVVVYAAADPDVCPLCARGDHSGCSGCRCEDRGHYGLALEPKENPDD